MLTPLTAPETLDRARKALHSGRGVGLPELLRLIESLSTNLGESTISEIAELIEREPAVLSRVLTVANTLMHNPGVAPVASIPQAIHHLGFNRVRTLAVSLMLLENTGGANPPEQREAAALALCAGLLAQGCAQGLGNIDPELAFACAALRQFGAIILPVVWLKLCREMLQRRKTMPEEQAARECFGPTPLELSRRRQLPVPPVAVAAFSGLSAGLVSRSSGRNRGLHPAAAAHRPARHGPRAHRLGPAPADHGHARPDRDRPPALRQPVRGLSGGSGRCCR